jgi:multiple sugar transport system substrate-binding protein
LEFEVLMPLAQWCAQFYLRGDTMTNLTRRALVNAGAALATAGALTAPTLLEWAKAWAQTAPWQPERGAQLSLLRWKYFIQAEDDAFISLIDASQRRQVSR